MSNSIISYTREKNMPGKLTIDFDLLEKIIMEDKSPVDEKTTYGLQAKVESIRKEYAKQAGLEKGLEENSFNTTWAGLVLASNIIGFPFALHALKRLQQECGEIKCFDPISERGPADRKPNSLKEVPITAEKLASYLVAYQLDCIKFKDKTPYVEEGKSEFRAGVHDVVTERAKLGAGFFEPDIFKEPLPTKNRRPSLS